MDSLRLARYSLPVDSQQYVDRLRFGQNSDKFNTENRINSTSIWESNMYKLLSNCVYGYFLLNLYNRIDVKLCQDPKEMLKYIAKPTFEYF